MPLPSSGTLALVADIGDEQRRPTVSGNVVSVADCGIAAGFSTPFAFSDFYNYAHITRSPYDLGTPAQTLIGIQAAPSTILNTDTKCTIQVLGRFTENTTGVIYETGGATRGLAIYITSGGVLYCNAGVGGTATGSVEMSNTLATGTDIREITVGIELLPYIRGTMYVNGSNVSSNVYGGQYSSGVSASGNSGTGQVYDTIRVTHGPTTSAIANGTILACNIWDGYGLIPRPVSPSTDMLSRVSYTSGNYFAHSSQLVEAHEVWGHPSGEQIYLLNRAGPGVMYKYDLSTKLDPTSASYTTSRSYTGIARPEGFSVQYSDGTRVYTSEDGATTPFITRYDLATDWDPTSSLSSLTVQQLTGGDFVGTARAPQGVEWFELSYTASSQRIMVMDQTGYLEVRGFNTMSTVYQTFTINSTNVSGWSNRTDLSSCKFFYGGYKLLVTASGNDNIYEFDLSTAYDITTITYSGSNVNLNTLIGSGSGGFNGSTFTCRGIWGNTYHPEETGLWVCGSSSPNRCFKIDLSY